jgi:hypothetical protein
MKVYGWIGWRRDVPRGQTREIVVARSMAEVGRIVGCKPRELFNLGETGNPDEIATASAEPGVVFWKPLDDHRGEWRR